MQKEIKKGDVFESTDRLTPDGRGRRLTVLRIREGGKQTERFHPQLNYAECGVVYPDGRIGKTFVAIHRLIAADYKHIESPAEIKAEAEASA